MPIYEFLCPSCNTVFSFHSFKVDTEKVPACPRCGGTGMRRMPSRFGIASTGGKKSGEPAEGPGAEPDLDDPRVEREMMRLVSEMEGMDENDPRQMARVVRKMAEITGEPVTPAMEEMIRRLEAGEDPEEVEEELGDALEEEMGGEGAGGGAPDYDDGLYPL
jgi:putative FmdB family regulatory protein